MPGIDSKVVFWHMVGELFSNTLYFGIGCVAIIAIAALSWGFAFVLFVAFTLVVIASVIHQIIVLGANFTYLYSILTGKSAGQMHDYLFLSGANLVELLELGVLIFFNLLIYRALYT